QLYHRDPGGSHSHLRYPIFHSSGAPRSQRPLSLMFAVIEIQPPLLSTQARMSSGYFEIIHRVKTVSTVRTLPLTLLVARWKPSTARGPKHNLRLSTAPTTSVQAE